jgi:hypothetical protein
MCATCNRINQQLDTDGVPLDADKTKLAFADIAAAIRKGRGYTHFEKVTNRLLGTEMAPRDRALETRWQQTQQNPRSDE